ncbi:hypothetical protein OF377_02655 [Ureaplasma sp. ES3154-GEN]|uniref:hypothetical protein n=1 Tax=Ureaplasma sp. ES3154-GEN TaxID=2984844 RepID=UPI0021E8963B|nr:hypothetical protein [Ureaplasma sp. ES3154-GEN]MCV3743763.1 hypothetical protein [Ureaplasma sp. ES3154-GEN]
MKKIKRHSISIIILWLLILIFIAGALLTLWGIVKHINTSVNDDKDRVLYSIKTIRVIYDNVFYTPDTYPMKNNKELYDYFQHVYELIHHNNEKNPITFSNGLEKIVSSAIFYTLSYLSFALWGFAAFFLIVTRIIFFSDQFHYHYAKKHVLGVLSLIATVFPFIIFDYGIAIAGIVWARKGIANESEKIA